MEILLLLGIYLVELLCYQVVLRMLFQMKVTTKKWMILGAGLPIVIGLLPMNDTIGKNLLITISVIIIMFVSMEGTIIYKGIRLILMLLFFECIDDIFAYSCGGYFILVKKQYRKYISSLVSKSLTYISTKLICSVREKFKRYKNTHINSAIYFIIGVFILLMFLCLGFLNQVIIYFPNERYIQLCEILNIAILASILLLVVFIIYINNTHERMEQLLKTEKLLKESQVNYYKQSLKKETDTRKYRHDMVNHLIYVQEILSQNRIDDAQQYLSNILDGFKKIQSSYYVTGNEMFDTIMNYFFAMLPKEVKIEIRGKCPVVINMEEMDICTIFSNIFQNAVEEILDNSVKNACIKVIVSKGQQYVKYEVKNSLYSEINMKCLDKYGLPKSHKTDKHNHGIGMVNIKNAIERNNGKFEWNQKDGYFCVSVILPIKL